MFKANTKHKQIAWISNVNDLPEKQRKRLEASWAGTFYTEFFNRIDERAFEVLYSDGPSRPNVPVNVLVGLDTLKAGFGWSDDEMHDAFLFDLQVRYALGYHTIGDGEFDLRTVYNFRKRVTEHGLKTGEDLIEKSFEQITDEQVKAYELKTGKQRMDSTHISSNIRDTTRLRLLVEVLQRVHRVLKEADQERYANEFAPYLKGNAGQYVYRIKAGDSEPHLQQIGELMHKLVSELAATYANEHAYQILERVFREHFVVNEEAQLRPKQGEELSANSLQSPDDEQATYRRKRGEDHVGYVGNVTETCDPENDLQLIVKVQVEPNTTDDAKMLDEALPQLKERTDLDEMHTDGGYNSADVDNTLADLGIELVQSAIRGAKPSSQKLGLENFQWKMDAEGQPCQLTCPEGKSALVIPGHKPERYLAHFKVSDCNNCPHSKKCPAQPLKRKPQCVLRFSKQQVNVAMRRQRTAQVRASGQNLRAAVEATVRSVKHPFRNGKVLVRGQARISMVVIGSAAMCNVRRIWRHLNAKTGQEGEQKPQVLPSGDSVFLFLSRLPRFFSSFFAPQCQLWAVGH